MTMKRMLLGAALVLAPGMAHAAVQRDCTMIDDMQERANCDAIQAAQKGKPAKLSKADQAHNNAAKAYNDASAAAQAKIASRDFAGAATIYQAGIDAEPSGKFAHLYNLGLAIALRRQAVAGYSGGPKQTILPPGSTNDQIRMVDAANKALVESKTATAVALLKRAQAAAVIAATGVDASKDRAGEDVVGAELREDASLLYQLDRANTLTTPRGSAALEAKWLRKWLASGPAGDEAARAGFAVAANLSAGDPAAGLTLADEVLAKSGGTAAGAIGYANIVAAKAPAGDPRRAKALAGLKAVPGSDAKTQADVARLTTALGA